MRLSYQETGTKAAVALWLDNTNHTQVKAFHCLGCGYVVFQYYSDTKILVAGDGPVDDTVTPVVRCQCKNSQCKLMYDIYR